MKQSFLIAGHRITREEMSETRIQYVQSLLREDYQARVRPQCLCRDPGLDMVIRKLGSRYVLARMPDSGSRHDVRCASFDIRDDQCGLSGYTDSAIAIALDGTTHINLGTPLTKRKECLPDQPPQSFFPAARPSRKRSQTTLLGMLHHLWHEAQLNRWHPNMKGKRSWDTVYRHIGEVCQGIFVHRRRLAEILFIPEPFAFAHREAQQLRFLDFVARVMERSREVEHCGLLLSEIAACSPKRTHVRIEIRHLREFALRMTHEVFTDVSRRFGRALAFSDRANGLGHAVGLFVVGVGSRERGFPVYDACVMPVTRHWVPVDSQYECRVAEALVEEGRSFLKPLRYDAGEEQVFPDFLLLDAGEKLVPMEIYGITGNREYERRKREKIAFYQDSGELFWQWDADPVTARKDAWMKFPERFVGHGIASRTPVACGGTLKRVGRQESLAPVLLSESTVGR